MAKPKRDICLILNFKQKVSNVVNIIFKCFWFFFKASNELTSICRLNQYSKIESIRNLIFDLRIELVSWNRLFDMQVKVLFQDRIFIWSAYQINIARFDISSEDRISSSRSNIHMKIKLLSRDRTFNLEILIGSADLKLDLRIKFNLFYTFCLTQNIKQMFPLTWTIQKQHKN